VSYGDRGAAGFHAIVKVEPDARSSTQARSSISTRSRKRSGAWRRTAPRGARGVSKLQTQDERDAGKLIVSKRSVETS